MNKYILLFASIALGCQSPKPSKMEEPKVDFYENGHIKRIWKGTVDKKAGYEFSFYEGGSLKSIFYYENGIKNGEQLWFHENGFLDRKLLVADDTADGMAYYFFPSGNLKSDRYFKNDVEYRNGVDYWDEPFGIIKYSLHFNDSGKVYYRKLFDTTGKLIGEEGKR